VKYLTDKEHEITVASQFLEEAQAIADDFPTISISELNVADDGSLGALVFEHDLTISFVPYQFHVNVAKQCIKYSKHMITASYEFPEIKALHQQAVDKNICILNEIGLDPGIDHLSAMQMIDSINENGGSLKSFVSWCGGLPALSSNNNPLGYKFAWAPKSVLLALLNSATFLKAGKVVTVDAEQLLKNVQKVILSSGMELEGYPNRDSVSYRDIYGLDDAEEVFRGTLRYPGFSEILQCCKELGLLDQNTNLELDANSPVSWKSLLEDNVTNLEQLLSNKSKLVYDAITWLGLLDINQTVGNANSMIDAFCQLLIEKLSYTEDEVDMVVLQHELISINAQDIKEIRHSTIILEGDVDGYSAMAKTVGTPAAIAADLILSGVIEDRGVVLPMNSGIYTPILAALEEQGITLDESLVTEKTD
ncbi:MAG: saccharopine dehydrogenase, partial [Gammaproteobacteria bacterium]|nr:saccharopine dehydrogenase [Gammaproteobacteria bacterium]